MLALDSKFSLRKHFGLTAPLNWREPVPCTGLSGRNLFEHFPYDPLWDEDHLPVQGGYTDEECLPVIDEMGLPPGKLSYAIAQLYLNIGYNKTTSDTGTKVSLSKKWYADPANKTGLWWHTYDYMKPAVDYLVNHGYVDLRKGERKTHPDLPGRQSGGYSIHPAMGLGGCRQITEDDIRPLIP